MGWWSTPRPSRFTPGEETRYPYYRRMSRSQSYSGRMRKISSPPGFDPRTLQPIVSRYTHCAIHNGLRPGQNSKRSPQKYLEQITNFIIIQFSPASFGVLFLSVALQPKSSLRRLHFSRFLDHAQLGINIPGRTPLHECSARSRGR
jgi:hypothetical protein